MIKQLLILSLALAAGCAGTGPLKSFTSEAFPVWSGSAVVKDVLERLYSAYPPGRTALYLAGSGDFAQALEDALRGQGYTIHPEAGPGALSLAWTVDRLDDGAWFLIVRLSDGYRFSRVYQDTGLTMTPAGVMSQGYI